MPLTVVLKELGRRCVALVMSGELDADSQGDLARAHDQAVAGDPDTLVLDLGDLSHLDGDGVGLLTALMVRARQCGRSVRARGLSPEHERLFALGRLEGAIAEDVRSLGAQASPPVGTGPTGHVAS